MNAPASSSWIRQNEAVRAASVFSVEERQVLAAIRLFEIPAYLMGSAGPQPVTAQQLSDCACGRDVRTPLLKVAAPARISLPFYLASQSPRRRELLTQLGYQFEIVAADIPEIPAVDETPRDYALRIALEKARAGARNATEIWPVVGADTDVVLDGVILGKPADEADALRMLRALSGRSHEVYSAVAIVQGSQVETVLSVTEVQFGEVSEAAARAYWATGEPKGKAGAYAIQGLGAQFVRAIRGSYSGVVGLPLHETCALLQRFGIQSLS